MREKEREKGREREIRRGILADMRIVPNVLPRNLTFEPFDKIIM